MLNDASRPLRVLLVDDADVVRRGVASVLAEDEAIRVVAEASSLAEALRAAVAARPDVVVTELRLPDGDGVALCRALRRRLPAVRILVLTSAIDQDGSAMAAAAAAGATGFLPKHVRGAVLVAGVRTVAAGGSVGERAVRPGPPAPRRPPAGDRLSVLTEQERTVLRLIGEGLTNRQIGERMGLAEKTVKNYTSHLLAKLGLERRTQAAILATELRERVARG